MPVNMTIIPSGKKWVFDTIYKFAFPYLYSANICKMNRMVLTDEDESEYRPFQSAIATMDEFKQSKVNNFPVFPNVYQVCVKRKANQCFLSCSCLHYDHCGLPCSHVLSITNVLEDTMVKVEHWRVYSVYFGNTNSPLSEAIMKAISVQSTFEGYGTPISNECLLRCLEIQPERYVIHLLFNFMSMNHVPTNGRIMIHYYINN